VGADRFARLAHQLPLVVMLIRDHVAGPQFVRGRARGQPSQTLPMRPPADCLWPDVASSIASSKRKGFLAERIASGARVPAAPVPGALCLTGGAGERRLIAPADSRTSGRGGYHQCQDERRHADPPGTGVRRPPTHSGSSVTGTPRTGFGARTSRMSATRIRYRRHASSN
jgi:hypothetical protein